MLVGTGNRHARLSAAQRGTAARRCRYCGMRDDCHRWPMAKPTSRARTPYDACTCTCAQLHDKRLVGLDKRARPLRLSGRSGLPTYAVNAEPVRRRPIHRHRESAPRAKTSQLSSRTQKRQSSRTALGTRSCHWKRNAQRGRTRWCRNCAPV